MSYSLRHTFVTSDHHFGSWKNGPFVAFTQEQENELIEKWNNVVKPNDIVLYNGDFCDCDVLHLIQYVKKLNGQIKYSKLLKSLKSIKILIYRL